MSWVINRIEENNAVLEEIGTLKIKIITVYKLPKNAKEGDVVTTGSSGEYEIDAAETDVRKNRIKRLLDKIKNRRTV